MKATTWPTVSWSVEGTTGGNPWALLPSRLLFFLGAQGALAVSFVVAGVADPWTSAARWWLFTAAAANAASLALLVRALGGAQVLRAVLRFRRPTLAGDLRWLLAALLLAGPIAWLPNQALAFALWGDVNAGSRLMFQPLPIAACVAALFLFTPLQALSELPTYFFAATPALERTGRSRAGAVVLSALFLSLQHVALPFVADLRFVVWRAGMFLPFALAVGWLLRRRPTLLPYFVVVHLLMDAQLPVLTGLVSAKLLTM